MISNHVCGIFSYLLILYGITTVDAKIHLVKDEPENLEKELLRSLNIDKENRLNTDKVIAVIENESPGLAPRSHNVYRQKKKIKVKLIPTNHKQEFVTKILQIIKKYYEKKNKVKKLCHRHFGSIMDAKLQKYRCLNSMNSEETQEKNVKSDKPKKFVDETRSSGRDKRLKRHNRTYFHNPLIQIDSSNTDPMKIAINFVRSTVKPKRNYIRFSFDYYDDTRKFGNDVSEPMNLEEEDETSEITRTRSSDDSSSSSDDDSSDSEDSEPPPQNKDKIQKHGLKNSKNRFEIVDNLKVSSKQKNKQIQTVHREISSAELSEQITEKSMRNVNEKNYKNVKGYGDGVKNKFIYVQGQHRMLQSESEVDDSSVTSADSDEKTKRSGSRLSHFLPKRYIWDSEEFNDLGYFWFNGPQGMYPRLRLPH